ncbi:MAG: hypothetical protein ACR2GG_04415 [Gemmatimonadaceae bacterium]
MKLRRPSAPWIISIAAHAVIIVLFAQALLMHHPMFDFFGGPLPAATPPIERIGFLALPKRAASPNPAPGRSGGDGRSTQVTEPVRLVAPTRVPASVTPSRSTVVTGDNEPSTGPLVGGGGALRGVQPRYADPRLWGEPGTIAVAPKTAAERLDSVIVGDIAAHNDSIRVATGGQRAPGDWTFQRNGQKYGMDSKFIRLGPVSIPTAILALLPLNANANPTTTERSQTLNSRHDEIFANAQRGINEADFQKAVREIRQRKERERKEADRTKAGAADRSATSTPD